MEKKPTFTIVVYDNATVDVVLDGKQLPCTSIDFHAEMRENGVVDIPSVKLSLAPFLICEKTNDEDKQ